MVEILGPWLLNKGDDLMLRSITERLGHKCTLAVSSDLGSQDFLNRTNLPQVKWYPSRDEFKNAVRTRSLSRTAALLRRGAGLALIPRSVLAKSGRVYGGDLSSLLDASGFCYSDQWSVTRLKSRSTYYKTLKQQGAKLIMLPQALGPFEKPEVIDWANKVLQHFDVIYARDDTSREHMRNLDYPDSRVRVVPDITTLFRGPSLGDPGVWSSRVVVVPNKRMLDRTKGDVSSQYIKLLLTSIRLFLRKGLDPVMLLHERNDWPLAEEIRALLPHPIQILDEDAAASKAILGSCYAVFSSRYHALVGALSQGTPALGTSWSHKYNELFDEYGSPELLISPLADDEEIDSKLNAIVEPTSREKIRQRLTRKADEQRRKVETMWTEVEQILNLEPQSL